MAERPNSDRFVYVEADSHLGPTPHLHVNINREVNIHESTTHLYLNINKELHEREERDTDSFGDSPLPSDCHSTYTPSTTNKAPTPKQYDDDYDTSDEQSVTVRRIIPNANVVNERAPTQKRKVTVKETTLSRRNRFGLVRQIPSRTTVTELKKQPISSYELESIHRPNPNRKVTVFNRQHRPRDCESLMRTPQRRDLVASRRSFELRWCGKDLNCHTTPRDYYLSTRRPRRRELSPMKRSVELKWRRNALNCLTTPRNVFFLNVFTVKHYLLQVKISSSNSTLYLNTVPWSIRSGKHLHEEEFKKTVGPLDTEVQYIMNRQLNTFSPSRIVRFVLENCDGIPVIVSSDYARMISTSTNKTLVDRFVYQQLWPGSQFCYHRNCTLPGTAVRLDSKSVPTGVYCSSHVRRFGSVDNVMLYNPLLVAFTPRENNVVFSALNIEEVFRTRAQDSLIFPIRLRRRWTVICRKPQLVQLHEPTDDCIFFQTARNTLDCADEHFLLTKHFREIDVRHSLTRCLFKTFLPQGVGHIYSTTRTVREDLPYRWKHPYDVGYKGDLICDVR